MRKNLSLLSTLVLALVITVGANAQTNKVTKPLEMLPFLNKAIVDANQAKGGLHVVADAAARKAIKSSRLVNGMLVSQLDTKTIYRLVDATKPNLDASWEAIGTMDVYVSGATYSTGDVVLEDGIPYVNLKGTNTGKPSTTSADWRKVGEVNVTKDRTVAQKTALANMLPGDIVTVKDVGNGIVHASYVWSGTEWVELSKVGVTTGTVYAGQTDVTAKDATILATGDKDDDESSVARPAAISFDGTKDYFYLAFPKSWGVTPAIYLSYDQDNTVAPAANISQLTDCWEIFDATVAATGITYTVYRTNVSFKGYKAVDTKAEIKFIVK